MKAATKLIVHSTLSHFAGGVFHHLERIFRSRPIVHVQEEFERHSRRELRRAAKTTVDCVMILSNSTIGALQNFRREQIARLFG